MVCDCSDLYIICHWDCDMFWSYSLVVPVNDILVMSGCFLSSWVEAVLSRI